MNTISARAPRDCFNSLGIPVDNLTLDSAVDRIISMARAVDGRARLVSTLNTDFLVNSLGSVLTRPRHPELLEVLRSSDLVTADGFPIVWLSRIMRRPLRERVCGSDLLPRLAARSAREGLSIFLLGGGEGVAAETGRILTARYPGLRIAGSAAPKVSTAGEELARAAGDDEALLAEIHESGADILLVGLGNPKQELWFNRNRRKLRIPVSVGVGGSFEFITGGVRRAPAGWQKLNLEWLYRIGQDPGRLWKRYARGILKLAVLAAPVLWARAWELRPAGTQVAAPVPLPWRRMWSSREQSLALLSLPRRPGPQYLQRVLGELRDPPDAGELRILDFSTVRQIPLDAQQEFFHLADLLREQRAQLQLLGMTRRLRRQLQTARLMDLLRAEPCTAVERLTGQGEGGDFACRSFSLGDATLVLLSGRVDGERLAAMGFVECLLQSIRDRYCIIDLRNVELLESSGIAELMPLLTLPPDTYTRVMLSGVGHSTRQMLRMTRVGCKTQIIDDRELLRRIREGERHG